MALHDFPTGGTQMLRALRRYPDRIAFAWEGGAFSYRATLDLIARIEKVFATQGVGRGSRVAMLTSNRTETWCAGVAAFLAAAAVTWLHPLASLDDQLDQIADAEATWLVVDAGTFLARGGELAARAPSLAGVFTLGRADYGVDLLAAAAAAGAATAVDLATPEEVAALNYTGGTTGKAKGVLRQHRQNAAISAAVLADFELPAVPRFLAAAPISHVAGTKIGPVLMRGGTVHMLKRFDPEAVLATIARERINFTLLVPTMIYVLLDHPRLASTDLSSLELLLYGASPMSPARLVEALERIGPVFAQLYGQTECYPITVLRRADHDPQEPELFESCGFPVASCSVRLLDADDREVAPGEPGEICAQGPTALLEYWRRPEETAQTVRGGWVHTGDIARADDRGYLFILDRKKDMIVSGGFNIYPREVEDVLSAHAGVAMVAVIGIPDDKWGEAVTALVVPRAGHRPPPEELIDLVRRRKGSAHAPKRVHFVETLPTTGIGKVDKKALRAKFWAGQRRMVG
jgi:fatty-acyl-CoA synthase